MPVAEHLRQPSIAASSKEAAAVIAAWDAECLPNRHLTRADRSASARAGTFGAIVRDAGMLQAMAPATGTAEFSGAGQR